MASKGSTFSIDNILAVSPTKKQENDKISPADDSFLQVSNYINVSSAISKDSPSIVKPICLGRRKDLHGKDYEQRYCFEQDVCCPGCFSAADRDTHFKRQLAAENYPAYCTSCYELPCSASLDACKCTNNDIMSTSCETNSFCKSCFGWQKAQSSFFKAEFDRNKDHCITISDNHRTAGYYAVEYAERYISNRGNAVGNDIIDGDSCMDCSEPKIENPRQKTANEDRFDWMTNPRPFYKKENKRNQSLSESKRDRTTFSKKQRSELESQFQLSRYPSRYHRSQIARYLDLTEFQVKVWFQNRRMKYKRWSSAVNQTQEFIPSCYCSHVWHK